MRTGFECIYTDTAFQKITKAFLKTYGHITWPMKVDIMFVVNHFMKVGESKFQFSLFIVFFIF